MVNLWLIMVNSWNNNVQLVGGDWNHGILNDFPIILGMENSSQLTNSLHHFSEVGRWLNHQATKQIINHHLPSLTTINHH